MDSGGEARRAGVLCRAANVIRVQYARALASAFVHWQERSHAVKRHYSMQPIMERPMAIAEMGRHGRRITIADEVLQRSIGPIGDDLPIDRKADGLLATPPPMSPRLSAGAGRRSSVIMMQALPILSTSYNTELNIDKAASLDTTSSTLKSVGSPSAQADFDDLQNLAVSLQRAQVRLRWRGAIRRIIALRNYAVDLNKTASSVGGHKGHQRSIEQAPISEHVASSAIIEKGTICDRPIDYFIVFGVHPPKEFERVNFESLSEEKIEAILKKAQVFAGIIDRYPREDYPDCPVSDVWTSLAFPTGILLSWEKRQPKSHFAIVTFADGRKCFLTFLQFDQPISALLEESPHQSGKELYTPKAICLVSQYPHLSTYRKILAQLYATASTPSCRIPVESFVVQVTLELPVPVPGKQTVSMTISDPKDPIRLYAAPIRDALISRLPLHLLFDILGVDSILGIFSAMMFEQRILLHSNSLSALTIVCQTMLQLLYPFQWCSVYVPVLAELMLDAHQCPQPYIQGVHTKYLSQFTELNDIVLVDLDHDLIRCSAPLPRLPQQSGGVLWSRLRDIMERQFSERDFVAVGADDPYESSTSSRFDREVYDAFLTFFADLLSGFRRFLFFINDVPFFNGSGFLKSKSLEHGSYDFLDKLIESRAFDGFLEEESNPSLYNDYLATGSLDILNEIHEIESRRIDDYRMAIPKSESRANPNLSNEPRRQAFAQPLRKAFLNKVPRIELAARSEQTVSTRRAHKKRPDQNALNELDQMKYYMAQIFSNEGFNQESLTTMSTLLHTASARGCLSSILSQPLSKGPTLCLSTSSFNALSSVLQAMLECCLKYEDYNNASAVLSASSVFFCESDGKTGGRTYIESALQHHVFWNCVGFWENTVVVAMATAPVRENDHQQFILDCLMKTAQRMITYGMGVETAWDAIQTMSFRYRLNDEGQALLGNFLKNMMKMLEDQEYDY